MNLTDEQRKAIGSNSQYIAILAGAGSGKTKTLTERICNLILEKGVNPEEILALTFSSKAAQEMKKRIIKNLGEKAKGLWVKTFHSFGLEMLRMYNYGFSDKNSRFEIVDASSKTRHIKSIINKHKLSDVPKDILQIISKIKNKITGCEKSFEKVFNDYNQVLRSNNLVDLDDLVWLTVDMIKNNPDVQRYLHTRFKYILIDEYQDTNDIQNEMIDLILSPKASLCVVGDDDQCIYEWRGSNPKYIKDFAGRKDVETIFLKDNFRSQKYIVELANKFIAHNRDRIDKQMIPRIEEKSKPLFRKLGSDVQEAVFIAETIKDLCGMCMYKYKDIAILIRSSHQTEKMISVFEDNSIPYSFKQEDTNAEFMPFIRVLYAVMDYKLNNNISRAVNFPNVSLDNFTYMDLVDDNNLNELSIIDALEYLYNSSLSWTNSDIFRTRYLFIKDLSIKNQQQKMNVTEIMSALLDFYVNEENTDDESKTQINFIKTSLKIAEEWEKTSSDCNVRSFIDYLMCAIENNDEILQPTGDDKVNIMTCHRAKGLEFPVVIIPGVHVGLFPNDYFIHSENDLEQERRLFYVAMTRAVERLIITCYQNPYGTSYDSSVNNGFIAEIPEIVEWSKESIF